uniref:Endodeoxyribonuclease RusA n=1 Tax=Myoviridae sp. ctpjm1 TaxID=2826699 RepID=A0A8S5NMM8_9CAUD|nr:MAG TPA: Endodeoxyribonuclease RusA [Myoviridae sp. ctpjm1]DAQ10774.1 MAG TPA: Endodeoxyribonuclease RusA [Caudoviricetes sp.]
MKQQSDSLLIRINGMPQGKGRPRFTKQGRTYTPQKTRRYEEAVRGAAMLAARAQGFVKHDDDTPLEACISAWFPIPASWPKKKREAARSGALYPVVKPDADNIAKAVLDALNGIAFHDDRQVVSCTVRKRYTFRDDDTPRVVVHVAPMKTFAQLREEALSDGLTGEQP